MINKMMSPTDFIIIYRLNHHRNRLPNIHAFSHVRRDRDWNMKSDKIIKWKNSSQYFAIFPMFICCQRWAKANRWLRLRWVCLHGIRNGCSQTNLISTSFVVCNYTCKSSNWISFCKCQHATANNKTFIFRFSATSEHDIRFQQMCILFNSIFFHSFRIHRRSRDVTPYHCQWANELVACLLLFKFFL